MRRPSFRGWLSRELKYLSGENTLNLHRLAYLAQASNARLWERLALYAIAVNQTARLKGYLYQEELIDDLNSLAFILNGVDLGNLNWIDSVQLPPRYEKALLSYKAAYQRIDTRNESKKLCWKKSVQLQKEKGVSNSQIYYYLNLDAGNTNAYLKNGDIDKVSLENATKIMKYLYSL